MMLCSLEDFKSLLGISGTTEDTKLNLIIKSVSAQIVNYLGRPLERKTYTEELHTVNNNQLLKVRHYPIQSVSEITINGSEVDDYVLTEENNNNGFIYRGCGWCGNYYTRGMTHDIVSGEMSIKVTYTAGYYLPDNTDYTEGAEDSLPYDIVSACLSACVDAYRMQGMEGIKSHSEGGISTTFGDTKNGFSEKVLSVLSAYKEIGVA